MKDNHLTPPPLTDLDGFNKHNTFGVKEAGDGLTRVVEGLTQHTVIVLDGPWGSGKTTFVRQWEGHLRSNGHPVIYWDAFQADHHEDPFFPMLAPVLDVIERHPTKSLEDIKDALHRHARVIVQNLGVVLLALLSELEPTTRTAKKAMGFGKTVLSNRDSLRDPDKQYFDSRLSQAKAESQAVEGFKKKLTQAVKALVRANAGQEGAPRKQPLVFIIDELDRCRPSFALDVLERVKHIFPSDGVCFVLVTHLPELTAMVKHAYGLNDAEQYLNKFYQLRIDIEVLLASGGQDVRASYIDYLNREMKLGLEEQANNFVRLTLTNLADVYNIGLRTLERILVNLLLYKRVGRCASVGLVMHLAAALCVMRIVSPNVYRECRSEGFGFSSASRFLRLEEWSWGATPPSALQAWWRLVTHDGREGVKKAVEEEMERLKDLFQREVPDGHPRLGALNPENVLGAISTDIDLFWQNS